MSNRQEMLSLLDAISSNETTKVNITKTVLEDGQDFYCIQVPSGAFLIRSDNKISVTGNCHAIAGAWAFKYKLDKLKSTMNKDEFDLYYKQVEEKIRDGARHLYQHEVEIIRMIFEHGRIEGITESQMIKFVQSRVNLCLKELGFEKEYEVTSNPIAEWFYKSLSDFSFNDFFSSIGNEYQRDWDESNFVWKAAA